MKHLGIIPDGHRRWAVKHPNASKYGHKEGLGYIGELIPYLLTKTDLLTIYLMAPHNWKRDEKELLDLFPHIIRLIKQFENEPRVTFIVGYAPRLPAFDLIVRTGGYNRLSGFPNGKLLVVDKLWPDITKEDFDEILA